MDYVAFFANELAYVGAVERLIDIEVPPRAQWIRTLFAELNRIHSHLIYLGTSGVELGAISLFFYCLRERDSGARPVRDGRPACACTTATRSSAACSRTCPRASTPRPAGSAPTCPSGSTSTSTWWPATRSGATATRASAPSTPTRRSRWACPARTCARRGVPYDLRRVRAVPGLRPARSSTSITGESGDAYDRLMCRTKEMYESVKLIEQCLDSMPAGPVMADDRKYVLPPRHELHTSMESLIHHFKLVTEGFRVPPGQVYYAVESPRGEFGCYLVSDGGAKPWRVHFRAPSFVSLQCDRDDGGQPLHRRPDRGRRLARRRHGRGRPVTRPGHRADAGRGARDAAGDAARRRPSRPATGRCATASSTWSRCTRSRGRPSSRRCGWRRRSTDGCPRRRSSRSPTRPASRPRYCKSVASFYDMFRLQPVGRHEICVCTNLSCALVGAGDTLRALEQELGIHAGETTRGRAVHAAHRRVLRRLRLGAGGRRSTSATTSRSRRERGRSADRTGCAAEAGG